MDERPRTGVAVCCLTRYQNLIEHEGLKYHGIYYFVPGMLKHFDIEAVVALAAPRPMLFMSGEEDGGSPADGIRVIQSKSVTGLRALRKNRPIPECSLPRSGARLSPRDVAENSGLDGR